MAYNYLTDTGVIVPDTADTLAEVQAEFKEVFGAGLDLTPSTPQGILITAETLARDDAARLTADVANQFNPNNAGGIFLDAICGLFGLQRVGASKTTVTATIVGDERTTIYAGAQAQTTSGDIFELVQSVVIPATGSIDAQFQSVEYGAIPCASGTLTKILDGILGWTSITNTDAGVLGVDQQSDLSLSATRRRTLARQGVATTEAIISALYDLGSVHSLQLRENTDSVPQVIDTISMLPHSIYVCVYGGTDEEVAQTILSNKSAGTAMNGTTTVAVTASSGQVIDVKFDRPTLVPVLARLTVKLSAGAAGDATDTIKQNIIDYANGLIDGEDGFVVGGSVSPFEISGAAIGVPGAYVKTCEVALASDGIYQSTEISININEMATITTASIAVTIL